jgi:DNA modification methylase
MTKTVFMTSEETLSDQKEVHGFIFACTRNSQDECFKKMLFGTNRQYGAVAMRVRKGDFLFLLNLDTDVLYGIFRAASDGQMNLNAEAWNGNYPYQIAVEALDDVIPIAKAKKLLKEMGIGRLSVLGRKGTLKLLEFFRPYNVEVKEWRDYIFKTQIHKEPHILEQRNWELLGKIEKITDVEEIPLLQATTLWDFPRQSYGKTPKGDNKYAGVTPAELIWNLVWRYTEPGDLVVDPMCGSGTTIDVCKEEGRRAICYDISPPQTRQDVTKNDARKIPLETESVDLVFVDSPYGDNIKYNNEPANIGNISSESKLFYDELEKVMVECHRILKPGKVLGWLIGDQWVKKKFTPVGFEVYNRLCNHFNTVEVVCIVRRGQYSHTAPWYNRARRFNFYLRGFKYLFIMRKPKVGEKETIKERKVNWSFYERKQNAKEKQ